MLTPAEVQSLEKLLTALAAKCGDDPRYEKLGAAINDAKEALADLEPAGENEQAPPRPEDDDEAPANDKPELDRDDELSPEEKFKRRMESKL